MARSSTIGRTTSSNGRYRRSRRRLHRHPPAIRARWHVLARPDLRRFPGRQVLDDRYRQANGIHVVLNWFATWAEVSQLCPGTVEKKLRRGHFVLDSFLDAI